MKLRLRIAGSRCRIINGISLAAACARTSGGVEWRLWRVHSGSAQRLASCRPDPIQSVVAVTDASLLMFKKQFTTKTEAPLRGSDRRKLRSSVIDSYNLATGTSGKESQPTEADTRLADLLVPNGIKSTKFTTSLGEHGVNTSLC